MKRHAFDAISFVFGLVFLGFALLIGLPESPLDLLFDGFSFRWLAPLAVIVVGAALLIPVIRRPAPPVTAPGPMPEPVEDVVGESFDEVDAARKAALEELPDSPLD